MVHRLLNLTDKIFDEMLISPENWISDSLISIYGYGILNMVFFRWIYMKSMLSPNTACHFGASVCFKFKGTILHCLSVASWQRNENLFIGHLCHGKNRAIKCVSSCTSLPLCPSHLIPPKREGKNCLSEQKQEADLTATRTICQTIWLLSSPDRREEWCVRKDRELKIQRAGFSSWVLPFPPCEDLMGLGFLQRDLQSPMIKSLWETSLHADIKNGGQSPSVYEEWNIISQRRHIMGTWDSRTCALIYIYTVPPYRVSPVYIWNGSA